MQAHWSVSCGESQLTLTVWVCVSVQTFPLLVPLNKLLCHVVWHSFPPMTTGRFKTLVSMSKPSHTADLVLFVEFLGLFTSNR